ncbi:MAG: NAD-binding protein [Fidelibacterota bacterium]|nr:MAG: NAD-binding protein [Candidatus Neomarinimicrobiota bacterium]
MGIRESLNRHPVIRVIGLILVVAFVGGLGVLILELTTAGGGEIKSLPEAFWWAIVTMTTVGYGDYTPQGPLSRILAMVIMFAGISLMAVLSGTIASRLVTRRLRANQGLMSINVKNHIIICGWHHKIESLLDTLLNIEEEDTDFQIVLINEEQEDKMQSLKNQYGYTRIKYIRGEFTREATLRQAQLEHARAVIILPSEHLTGDTSDEKTILATLTIKNMCPNAYVVAYVHDQNAITHVKRADADDVVLCDTFSSFMVASHVLNPGIPQAANKLLDSASSHHFRREPIASEFIDRPFEELFLHYRKEYGWITVGLYLEEEQSSFTEFLSADSSQLDAFIERKLKEAGRDFSEGRHISVIVNPEPDRIIRKGEGAIIIP